jgi:hypothetical protein
MDELEPRLFASDAEIRRIGTGLVACSLARADWTHEAHLAACFWLVEERPDIDAEVELPGLIRAFNESVGGVNDDSQGYHETITQCFLRGVRLYRERAAPGSLAERVNGLLAAPEGKREWPLRFYSEALLFSVAARRSFVPPDRAALPALREAM